MNHYFLSLTFALRELKSGLSGFKVFIICVALGVASITGVNSINKSIRLAIEEDAQELLGGDLQGRKSYSPINSAEIKDIQKYGRISNQIVMRSMARSSVEKTSQLFQTSLIALKAVDDLYPLYGELNLDNDKYSYHLLDKKDGIWGSIVDASLKKRFSVNIGDNILIGNLQVEIRGFIDREPDRALSFSSSGPRVIISKKAMIDSKLLMPGSLVTYIYNISLFKNNSPSIVKKDLVDLMPTSGLNFKIASEANDTLKKFFNNILVYLTFLSLSIIVISGVGVGNSANSYLISRLNTIAIMKSLGCNKNFVFKVYCFQFLILTFFGIFIGFFVGTFVPFIVQYSLVEILPFKPSINIDIFFLIKVSLLVLITTFMFFLFPLLKANNITIAELFRARNTFQSYENLKKYVLTLVFLVLSIFILLFLLTGKFLLTFYFILGVLVTFILFLFIAKYFILTIKFFSERNRSIFHSRPIIRLALSNLWRVNNPTVQIILSLGLALSVVVSITQLERNLSDQVFNNIPKNAPSIFFIDIQSNQKKSFLKIVNNNKNISDVRIAKLIRGRIVGINDLSVKELKPKKDIEWIFRGERGISQAPSIPKGTVLVNGEWWDAEHTGENLLSIDNRVYKSLNLSLGDSLTVNILGREIEGKIYNTRDIEWQNGGMNFTLIFSPNALEGVPGSYMSTVSSSSGTEDNIEREVVVSLPNVSVIQVKEVVQLVKEVSSSLLIAIRIPIIIAVLSGILVLISAIIATNLRRVYESVLFKVLGAKRLEILSLFVMEYILLGLTAGIVAAIIGNISSFLILKFFMNIEPILFFESTFIIILFSISIVIIVGLISMWNILGAKSNIFMRNE